MKNLSYYTSVFGTLIIFFFLVILSCKPHTLVVDDTESIDLSNLDQHKSTFEIIVSGLPKDSICPLKKALKIIPVNADCNMGNDKIERCSCSEDLQKWKVDSNLFSIEDAISTVREKGGGGREGEGIDVNFEFNIPKIGSLKIGERQTGKHAEIVDNSENIIVAILDTGVSVNAFNEGEASFLKTVSMNENCLTDDSGTINSLTGWNFVQNNADTRDQHGHGTFIALNIMNNLFSDDNTKKFSYLPLKVFDDQGRGTYWNIVCALAYIERLGETKDQDIAIINASFGINLEEVVYKNDFSILKMIIDKLKDSSIIVSSAGNSGFDNDKIHHFPSSFSSEALFNSLWSKNVASVAGLDATAYDSTPVIQLNNGSNFGLSSVNSATPWLHKIEDLNVRFPIFDSNGRQYERVKLKGTSYSASFFTAKLLDSILESETSQRGAELLDSFIQSLPKSKNIENKLIDGAYIK